MAFVWENPGNIQAKLEGYSFIVAASQNVIPKVADKVLAMTQEWAETASIYCRGSGQGSTKSAG